MKGLLFGRRIFRCSRFVTQKLYLYLGIPLFYKKILKVKGNQWVTMIEYNNSVLKEFWSLGKKNRKEFDFSLVWFMSLTIRRIFPQNNFHLSSYLPFGQKWIQCNALMVVDNIFFKVCIQKRSSLCTKIINTINHVLPFELIEFHTSWFFLRKIRIMIKGKNVIKIGYKLN